MGVCAAHELDRAAVGLRSEDGGTARVEGASQQRQARDQLAQRLRLRRGVERDELGERRVARIIQRLEMMMRRSSRGRRGQMRRRRRAEADAAGQRRRTRHRRRAAAATRGGGALGARRRVLRRPAAAAVQRRRARGGGGGGGGERGGPRYVAARVLEPELLRLEVPRPDARGVVPAALLEARALLPQRLRLRLLFAPLERRLLTLGAQPARDHRRVQQVRRRAEQLHRRRAAGAAALRKRKARKRTHLAVGRVAHGQASERAGLAVDRRVVPAVVRRRAHDQLLAVPHRRAAQAAR